MPITSIDKNARERFEHDVARFGCAGISVVQSCYRALPIEAHRHEYLTGNRGRRDGRSSVFSEASKLKNSVTRVLSFFLAIGQMGYKSTVATEEVLAAQIRTVTYGMCSPRTFRAALALLVRLGWLSKSLISTGTRIIIGYDSDGEPVWKSLRVNKITLTPAALALISRRSMCDKSVPRQKFPPTKEDKVSSPFNNDKGLRPLVEEIDTNIEVDTSSELSESEDKTTRTTVHAGACPDTLEHRALKPASGRKPAEKTGSVLRRKRNSAPKTWDIARRLLLHDLEQTAQMENEPDRKTLLRVATLQTDRRYPRLSFCAVNWDKWLPKWIDINWAERRRVVKLHLLPELAAFCAHLTPPDVHLIDNPRTSAYENDKMRAQLDGYRRLRTAMSQVSRKIFFAMKTRARKSGYEQTRALGLSDNEILFTLDQIPWLLNAGRLMLSNVRPQEHKIFSSLAESIGLDD